MAMASTATIERVQTTLSVEGREQIEDDFDDIIHGGYFDEDDDGPHDEFCQFYIGECDQIARFWLVTSRNGEKRFYCPKHFALILHDIVDAMAHSTYFAAQQTPAQRRDVFHTFLIEWGRFGF
ncbi:hypothetical protein DSM100688_1881 [Bifidobacterium ramosum]|uniref:Uncharacterized protein n=1 Tax=Bifidobacterium ramosum TaxID=1798158 RepID=A0A6L4WXY5_9BIFI|nr:hypothetical protein [Bifidobacterium ramosum]KAB8287106.1 hypothetical protein DSM100688_1881 [Bifidobacterium ramosum]NEG71831.1 hypothetical protein [Bifidobacterium ramosum]